MEELTDSRKRGEREREKERERDRRYLAAKAG
jgi:hypothetical protein